MIRVRARKFWWIYQQTPPSINRNITQVDRCNSLLKKQFSAHHSRLHIIGPPLFSWSTFFPVVFCSLLRKANWRKDFSSWKRLDSIPWKSDQIFNEISNWSLREQSSRSADFVSSCARILCSLQFEIPEEFFTSRVWLGISIARLKIIGLWSCGDFWSRSLDEITNGRNSFKSFSGENGTLLLADVVDPSTSQSSHRNIVHVTSQYTSHRITWTPHMNTTHDIAISSGIQCSGVSSPYLDSLHKFEGLEPLGFQEWTRTIAHERQWGFCFKVPSPQSEVTSFLLGVVWHYDVTIITHRWITATPRYYLDLS